MTDLHIGCSGFNYPDWRGDFYPANLPEREWLRHYSTLFRSVELNVTFYLLLKPETFCHWHQVNYATCYTSDELRADARRVDGYLAQGLAVDLYVNNDANAHAPANALELQGTYRRR